MVRSFILICCFFSPNWEVLWAFLTAAGTIALAWVGYSQLKQLVETNRKANVISQEEFLYKLKSNFFTKDARDLLILIQEDALFFRVLEDDSAIFEINVKESRKEYLKDSIAIDRKYYSTSEIDDFFLNPLEDVGVLLKKELITVKDVSQNFGYYLRSIFSYSQIAEYIKWARQEPGDYDVYDKAEWAFHMMAAYEIENGPDRIRESGPEAE